MGKSGSSKYEAQLFKQNTKMILKIIYLCSTTCSVTICFINFSRNIIFCAISQIKHLDIVPIKNDNCDNYFC